MVTLKNNFGVEPDKDNPVMNASEGTGSDAKSSTSGHPKAILNCRRNSHPFQTRTLILNTPAKIGRSVARARPSSYNGIFDCKVLSRNHAIIWYEYDAGKFMIQDTKSSNGTFVNNQRLSKGGETSLPREFFSRDVVQFGVDVLENQRKCNEESDNSDDSNHIVTHGCIVATVRLFHPNGKESKSGQPYSTSDPIAPIPQEQICKLKLIIYETQQREGRLHEKLEELQLIVSKLEIACQETLTNRFEETRLLSKIANLEKQTKVMSRAISGSGGKGTEKFEVEIQQLLADIEKLQTVAREIQERQHRKLLESEQKLIEAQRVASNLELEVIALREQASVTEKHIEEMGVKCTAHCQTIDILKSNYHAQLELTQKLEARMTKFEEREGENELKLTFPELSLMDKYKFITGEVNDDANKKEKGNQEIIFEKCKSFDDPNRIEEKDFINEDDKTEWLTKKFDDIVDAMCSGLEHVSNCIGQLEDTLMDVERSKKKVEKLCIRSQALSLELNTAKMPVEEIKKTEKEYESETFKPVSLPPLSNEKITELEMELEENEELLGQARLKQRESEGKYTKLRSDLDATIKRCEKLIVDSCRLKTLLKNYFKCFEVNANSYKEKISKLESEIEDMVNGKEHKPLEIMEKAEKNTEAKETQTISVCLTTSSTNTDNHSKEEKVNLDQTESSKVHSPVELHSRCKGNIEQESLISERTKNYGKETERSDHIEETTNKHVNEPLGNGDSKPKTCDLGTWEKIQKIQTVLSSQLTNEAAISSFQIKEMRNLMNLLTEDLVRLLLREQQISKHNESLQRKLNKAFSQDDLPAMAPALHLRTVLLFSFFAIAAYFIYLVFL